MNDRPKAILLLVILLPLPSLGVWLSMGIPDLRGSTLGQALYFVAKFLFYAIPLCLFFWRRQDRHLLGPLTKRHFATGMLWGLALSAGIAMAMLICHGLNVDLSSIREAAYKNGLDSWAKFLGLALYLSFFNSFMEEFVWRFFLFRQSQQILTQLKAVIFINLAFAAHHFLALSYQTSLLFASLGAIAVFAAGCFWSYLLLRSKSIWPAYLSHICVDLAIFAWAGRIIFG